MLLLPLLTLTLPYFTLLYLREVSTFNEDRNFSLAPIGY